ncbi:MAG TPA: hypothetical protein VGO74_10935 [Modestobacter sp.]|nr:hypothetical protein [Modestobacter sp.]
MTSASGDITIGRASRGTVRLTTVSADARVAVEPRLRVWLDVQRVSGRLYCDLDDEGPAARPAAPGRPDRPSCSSRSPAT